MRPRFKLPGWIETRRARRPAPARSDPRGRVKVLLLALALANVGGAIAWLKPWGGRPEDLESELTSLRMQLQRQQASLTRLRALADKIHKAADQQKLFANTWFMDRKTASSTILTEIGGAAKTSGLTPKEHAFVFEPIEGTDSLSMMTISANYEGTYSDLIEFVNLVDRSKRFLIIENISAAPTQAGGLLNARFKINTFVRQERAQAQPAPQTAMSQATEPVPGEERP